MSDSESDTSDDSYYDRLYAAACSNPSRHTPSPQHPSERIEVKEDSLDYFDRLQTFGEADSAVFLPESDVVWTLIANGMMCDTDNSAKRVLLSGENFADHDRRERIALNDSAPP